MSQSLCTWVLAHPVAAAMTIMAAVLLSLTLFAVWAPAGLALGAGSALAAVAQIIVQWSSKTPTPPPKSRPLTDIGDT